LSQRIFVLTHDPKFQEMNSQDFNKLVGLLSKLDHATKKATERDGSFKKYHDRSIQALNTLPSHLKRLEQGLRTAKIIGQEN